MNDKERQENRLPKIFNIPLTEIDDFPDHPFQVRMDEDMDQLVESVKSRGIITPITLRKKDDGRYEIVSGHRRKKACELAGLETVPAEIKELTRDEAIILMVESNLQRSVILPSEKAFAYKMRYDALMLSEINDQIIGRPKKKDDDSDKGSGNDGSGEGTTETKPEETSKQGTLILDATCAPQNIQFPTDARLLNDARVLTEKIIDSLHEAGLTEGKKPRTYREKAKKQYNRFSKNRKKTKKLIRKTIGQQLRYLRRNLGHIEKIAVKYPEYLKHLAPWLRERLAVIRMLYEQQKEMSESGTHRISDRIVSLSQPWVRPIVRGKQTADVEFGAKVEMSDVGGYLRVEDLRWNAFNESTTLQASVESYRECYGCYPERVLADKIFRTRENLKYCKERGIHLNGPKLGKPNQDPKVRKAQQYQEWLESGERGDIERRFGISKRCYSLGLVMTKLKHTSEVSIHLSVLTLNLQRKLRLLLRTFFRLLLMPLPAYVVQ